MSLVAVGRALRTIAIVIALLGAVMTVFAIRRSSHEPFSDFFDAAQAGYFVAVTGIVVIAVGSSLGPKRP